MKALQDKGFTMPLLPAEPHVDAHPDGSRSLSQLLKIAPEEFESLVGRLMIAMGMKSKVTKVSGDGGVDVVSESAEPIRGGCFFIQCKRFGPRNLVGVEAVRELMGVVHRERATKGVLITTSDFTGGARREAREFGNQIELINGEKLITLLSQYKV
jgi:restriction system protein